MTRAATGAQAELLAERYLTARGLTLVERNYRCRFGEVDLIMRDGSTLVFVEVRLRASAGFGGAAASITPAKQMKLMQTARHYLAQHKSQAACRFDALLLDRVDANRIEWIADAFNADRA